MHTAYIIEAVVRMRMAEAARVAATHGSRTAGVAAERRRWVRPIIWRFPLRGRTA